MSLARISREPLSRVHLPETLIPKTRVGQSLAHTPNAMEKKMKNIEERTEMIDGSHPCPEMEEQESGPEQMASRDQQAAPSSDEPDRQRPDANASTLRAPQPNKGPSDRAEVIARSQAARSSGNSRPLGILAQKEADLREGSAALANLSRFGERPPDSELLTHQLARSVSTGSIGGWKKSKLKGGAVALYSALRPRDASESILARVIVALNNATMDCFDRASLCGNVAARDVNLRQGIKGAATIADIIEQYENRRHQSRPQVAVGKVNVEAGGQAIVGKVEVGDRCNKRPGPGSVPHKATTETDD